MEKGAKVENLRKQPFFRFLGQIWPFLKMVKSKSDGTPEMDFNAQNPFLHFQNYIFQPKNTHTLSKKPGVKLKNVILHVELNSQKP